MQDKVFISGHNRAHVRDYAKFLGLYPTEYMYLYTTMQVRSYRNAVYIELQDSSRHKEYFEWLYEINIRNFKHIRIGY